MTALEAQAELEKGLAKVGSFDEAVLWLTRNPSVANRLTPACLLSDFDKVKINTHEAGQDHGG